ncbi:DUF2500 domain-containing protein [Kineosporia succinea]|uniref:DUF2500 domain-containing protein n=1 Tax=Kineosporia succinea TaxID=84632 RepID=A0ABT9NW06_9ACTN|nr:DUF2500 domain-containing protein [Kineosporia succinea]MDP9824602.1 hypothetical protein [Kineosporia succinea]
MDDPFSSVESGMTAFGVIFVVFAVVILLVFLIVFAVIVIAVGKGISAWNRNNNSPVLTVPATVIGKRQETRRSDDSSSTSYFLGFELPGHQRVELPIKGSQWGTLREGDRGRLTYQGTRFKGFDLGPQDV